MLQVRNNAGELPVHVEAGKECNPDSLKILIDRYPEGLSIRDDKGRLPLFCAIVNEHNYNTGFDRFYERYPQALTATDVFGNTPLGLACCRHSPRKFYQSKMITWILGKCPVSARILADSKRNPAVHIAAPAIRSYSTTLKLLVDAFPDSLLKENNDGDLPLLLTVASLDKSLTKVHHLLGRLQQKFQLLLEACPEAAS